MPNIDNCFYCQSLDNNFLKIGSCDFCKTENPLYLVNYQGQKKYFCCGCAWWQVPRSEKEKEEENKWYQEWKKPIIYCDYCQQDIRTEGLVCHDSKTKTNIGNKYFIIRKGKLIYLKSTEK